MSEDWNESNGRAPLGETDAGSSKSLVGQVLAFPIRALRIPLLGNALFLMLNGIASAVIGGAFWFLAARYYAESEVGLAAALIPLASYLGMSATLGLGFGLIRFLPEVIHNPVRARSTVNTSLTVSALIGVFLALVFLAGADWWTPRLAFVRENMVFAIAFILLPPILALRSLQTKLFVALRKAQYAFASSVAGGIRVPFLLLGFGGVAGLVAAFGAGMLIALVVATVIFLPWILRGYRPLPSSRLDLLKPMAGFSVGNQAATLLSTLPVAVLPLMVVQLRSPEENAWFYIAWFLGSMLYTIPMSLSTSLFAEGSQFDMQLVRDLMRTLVAAAILLTPAAAVLWWGGHWLLGLFGENYASGGLSLLRWLVLAAPFILVNNLYFTLVRIGKRVMPLVAGFSLIAVLTLGLSFLWLPTSGLEAIGVSHLTAQGLFAAVAGADLLRGGLLVERTE